MFDFVSASFCRGNSAGEQQRRAAMSCEGCAVKFTVFKRRRQCCICQRHYCTHCLQGGGSQSATSVLARLSEKQLKCAKCTVLTARPLSRSQLRQLRAKDLQLYLTSQKVSTHGCVEKDDLVNLLMRHAGGAQKSEPQSSQSHGYCQSGDQQASTSRNMGAEVTENRTTYATSETHSTPETPTTREMPEQQNSPEPTCHVSTSSSSSSLHSNPRSVGIDIVEVMDSSGEQSTSDSGPEPVIIIADEESSQADEVQAADAEEMAIEVEVEEVTDNAEEAMEVVEETEPIITTQACTGISLGSIHSVDDLDKLTVKQLKELLLLNRVDYRGCCEKPELVERVSRLWQDDTEARKVLDKMSMDELCKICMDAPVECVMLECGHMATCTACGKQLSECPICRQFVVRVVRTFRA